MMETKDKNGIPAGKGYNDMVYGKFVERNDGETQQYHAALRDMNITRVRWLPNIPNCDWQEQFFPHHHVFTYI